MKQTTVVILANHIKNWLVKTLIKQNCQPVEIVEKKRASYLVEVDWPFGPRLPDCYCWKVNGELRLRGVKKRLGEQEARHRREFLSLSFNETDLSWTPVIVRGRRAISELLKRRLRLALTTYGGGQTADYLAGMRRTVTIRGGVICQVMGFM